jgi:hypothetical protein
VIAQPPPPPPLPPPPKTIVLHVETDPPGAEVRQGDRVFGLAPRDVQLPRSNVIAHFTFRLDGYEDAGADVMPLIDDAVRVKLTPRPKRPKAPHRSEPTPRPATSSVPASKPADGETKPNPY